MNNHIINIDKLKIQFNNKNIIFNDIKDFEFHTINDNKHSITHHKNILVKYKKKDFCYLLHKDKLRNEFSKINIINKVFYKDNFKNILLNFISIFNINDYKITLLEISINTNKNLTKCYYNNYVKNKIICDKNYNSYSYLPTENRFTKVISSDTIYIKKEKSPIQIRIENKTNEIRKHSLKNYILKYYSENGLSTNKDIYRLEITIDFVSLRRNSRYIQYQNKMFFDNIISKNKYLKLTYLEQTKYNKVSIYNPYEIEINNINDEVYLASIFDYFSPFNYQILIKLLINKINFENRMKETKSITKSNKNDFDLQYNQDNNEDYFIFS